MTEQDVNHRLGDKLREYPSLKPIYPARAGIPNYVFQEICTGYEDIKPTPRGFCAGHQVLRIVESPLVLNLAKRIKSLDTFTEGSKLQRNLTELVEKCFIRVVRVPPEKRDEILKIIEDEVLTGHRADVKSRIQAYSHLGEVFSGKGKEPYKYVASYTGAAQTLASAFRYLDIKENRFDKARRRLVELFGEDKIFTDREDWRAGIAIAWAAIAGAAGRHPNAITLTLPIAEHILVDEDAFERAERKLAHVVAHWK